MTVGSFYTTERLNSPVSFNCQIIHFRLQINIRGYHRVRKRGKFIQHLVGSSIKVKTLRQQTWV